MHCTHHGLARTLMMVPLEDAVNRQSAVSKLNVAFFLITVYILSALTRCITKPSHYSRQRVSLLSPVVDLPMTKVAIAEGTNNNLTKTSESENLLLS